MPEDPNFELIREWFRRCITITVFSETVIEDCYLNYKVWVTHEMKRPCCSKKAYFKIFRLIVDFPKFKEFISLNRCGKLYVSGLQLHPYKMEDV